jgi:predicted phage terminase large subunit-like protein
MNENLQYLISKNPTFESVIFDLLQQGYTQEEILKSFIEEKENMLIQKAQEDFKTFCHLICKELFPVINLNEKWIDALFYEVNFLKNCEINFILNAPPRLGKTLFMSILFPCWAIGRQSNLKILIASASEQMRSDTNARIKMILKSNIYHKIFQINFSSFGAEIKQTDKLGNITLLSSGTNLTGAGYNIIITDDFFNPAELSTQHHITRKIFLENALGRKEHSPKTRFIVLEQRISLNDTTAILKSKWEEEEYKQITLKYQFLEDTYLNNIFFKANEYLSPRFDDKTKGLIIRERGINIFETQYQQNPIDSADVIVLREWWNYYSQDYTMLELKYVFFTCDLAFTQKTTADYSVICCWGIAKDGKLYLIDMLREQKEYYEIRQMIINFVNKYKSFITYTKHIISYKCLYIENVSNSKPLISDLKTIGIIIKDIPRKEDKYTRLSICTGEIEQGNVFLPNNKDFSNLLIDEAFNFRKEMTHRHDDIVDNLIDAITQELKINSSFNFGVFGKLI